MGRPSSSDASVVFETLCDKLQSEESEIHTVDDLLQQMQSLCGAADDAYSRLILMKDDAYSRLILHNLEIPSTDTGMVESLWLELSKHNSKYIVGGIYRHPNNNIGDFSSRFLNSVEHISKSDTPCVGAGGLNIDLSKYNHHQETTDYVNSLLVNNILPVLLMPTRITNKSATIIDHMYYFKGLNCKKRTWFHFW